MQCPYCGQEMTEGELMASRPDNLFWLPPRTRFPVFLTRQEIEKRGGVCLSGELPRSAAPAWRCPSCKKLILEY